MVKKLPKKKVGRKFYYKAGYIGWVDRYTLEQIKKHPQTMGLSPKSHRDNILYEQVCATLQRK